MKLKLFILFVLVSHSSYAQNLVLNGNFEDTIMCPYSRTKSKPDYIQYVYYWYQSNNSSPDFYNVCSPLLSFGSVHIPNNYLGSQYCISGKAYSGFFFATPWINNREYITGKLSSDLIKDSLYEASFFISTADNSYNAIDRIGAYFSKDSIYQNNDGVLPYKPQLESDSGVVLDYLSTWYEVKDTFRAAGGEKYITLGCFIDADLLSWHTYNPPVYIGHGAYYYVDSVTVRRYKKPDTVLPEQPAFHTMYPVPASDELHIRFTHIQPTRAELVLYDLSGRRTAVLTAAPSDSFSFQVKVPPALSQGFYLYRLFTDSQYFAGGKLLIVR